MEKIRGLPAEDMSSAACFAARDFDSFRAWKRQRSGWPERRGVRHWRPSANVKAHKRVRSFLCVAAERPFSCVAAERSFSCVAAERPTDRFVDMGVARPEDLRCQGSV